MYLEEVIYMLALKNEEMARKGGGRRPLKQKQPDVLGNGWNIGTEWK